MNANEATIECVTNEKSSVDYSCDPEICRPYCAPCCNPNCIPYC